MELTMSTPDLEVIPLKMPSNVRQSKRINLTQEAYNRIKNLLYNQELVPGQKVIYEDLARLFKMSTTPIISALSKLEQEGLMVSKFNRGFFVSEISVEEANDLIDARYVLEEYSVQKLIDNYTEGKIEYLDKLREELDSYRPSSYSRKRVYLDSYFHIGISEMAGNAYVKKLLATIFEKIYLRYRTERLPVERQESANREHLLLLDAIRRKDKKGALRVLQQHFRAVRENLINTIIQKE